MVTKMRNKVLRPVTATNNIPDTKFKLSKIPTEQLEDELENSELPRNFRRAIAAELKARKAGKAA